MKVTAAADEGLEGLGRQRVLSLLDMLLGRPGVCIFFRRDVFFHTLPVRRLIICCCFFIRLVLHHLVLDAR